MALQTREGSYDGLISTNDLSPNGAGLPSGVTTSQGLAVKLDTSNPGQFVLASSNSDLVIGFLFDQPQAGQVGTIRSLLAPVKSYAQLGATVSSPNTPLCVNSKGQLIPATQTAGGSQPAVIVVAYNIETGVAGNIVEVYPAGIGKLY